MLSDSKQLREMLDAGQLKVQLGEHRRAACR
jgi:hypothetical protein